MRPSAEVRRDHPYTATATATAAVSPPPTPPLPPRPPRPRVVAGSGAAHRHRLPPLPPLPSSPILPFSVFSTSIIVSSLLPDHARLRPAATCAHAFHFELVVRLLSLPCLRVEGAGPPSANASCFAAPLVVEFGRSGASPRRLTSPPPSILSPTHTSTALLPRPTRGP